MYGTYRTIRTIHLSLSDYVQSSSYPRVLKWTDTTGHTVELIHWGGRSIMYSES